MSELNFYEFSPENLQRELVERVATRLTRFREEYPEKKLLAEGKYTPNGADDRVETSLHLLLDKQNVNSDLYLIKRRGKCACGCGYGPLEAGLFKFKNVQMIENLRRVIKKGFYCPDWGLDKKEQGLFNKGLLLKIDAEMGRRIHNSGDYNPSAIFCEKGISWGSELEYSGREIDNYSAINLIEVLMEGGRK
ncbi:MAG: hypothetical protein AABX11_05150 [Nanoarchaeota archaeon]